MMKFVVVAGVAALVSAQEVPREQIAEVAEALKKDCGPECSQTWSALVSQSDKSGNSLVSELNQFADNALTNAAEFRSVNKSRLASFMRSASEIASNQCNYARVASMAAYQSLNLATHVFGADVCQGLRKATPIPLQ